MLPWMDSLVAYKSGETPGSVETPPRTSKPPIDLAMLFCSFNIRGGLVLSILALLSVCVCVCLHPQSTLTMGYSPQHIYMVGVGSLKLQVASAKEHILLHQKGAAPQTRTPIRIEIFRCVVFRGHPWGGGHQNGNPRNTLNNVILQPILMVGGFLPKPLSW